MSATPRRYFAWLLALTLLVPVLAACGGGAQTPEAPAATTAPAAEATEAPAAETPAEGDEKTLIIGTTSSPTHSTRSPASRA